MNTTIYQLLQIAVIVACTVGMRFLPFLIFRGNKQLPGTISFLGTVLPYAIMGMLLVYCLKDVTLLAWPYGLPEMISILLVAGLHLWKRNTLISIFAGTVCYMLLVQVVFAG